MILLKELKQGYKREVDTGVTHPLIRAALSIGFIAMMWATAFENPDSSDVVFYVAGLFTISLITSWVLSTKDTIA